MLRALGVLCLALLLGTHAVRGETIRMGGTGTVLALMRALAAPFERHSPADRLDITPGLGSSGAISAASQGVLDIAFSARALQAREQAAGLAETPFLETPFLFVSSASVQLRLSCAEVLAIYSGQMFTFPGGEVARLILRPRDDSTTKHMSANIEGMKEAMAKARLRPDIPVAPNDQDNMELAHRMPGAFTAMTLTQLSMEPNTLRPVILDGVEPSLDATRTGAYPHKQTISLVFKAEPSPGVRRFLAFLATDEAAALITRAGGVR